PQRLNQFFCLIKSQGSRSDVIGITHFANGHQALIIVVRYTHLRSRYTLTPQLQVACCDGNTSALYLKVSVTSRHGRLRRGVKRRGAEGQRQRARGGPSL